MMKQIRLMSLDDDDNMRGWDPASEDDSDDNGMERWSENNEREDGTNWHLPSNRMSSD